MDAHLPTVIVENADPLIGLSVGGYRIERFLAGGGMGLVYQARHELIDRRFAIKVLRPEAAADAKQARNFLAEAQTLSELKHPNIIDIVGFGVLPDGRDYMVMEFLEGVTLEDELARGRPPLERVLSLADQILSALNAAHSVEVIHRDLKPGNVFLARGLGGVETVKLLDFGLARHQPISLSDVGPGDPPPKRTAIAGTPEYIAPEQAMGGAPDKASDLYSFGVLLFEMACGRLPFERSETEDRVESLLRAHLSEEPPSPEQVGADVPPGLTLLLEELLSKAPGARPPSAMAVKRRLEAVRLAPIPLVKFQSTRRSRRSRMRAAGVGLVALGLGLVVVRSTVGQAAPSTAPALVSNAPRSGSAEAMPGSERAPDTAEQLAATAAIAPLPARVARAVPLVPRRPCQPDERWRAAAQVNLQELQQLAARRGHWADFERLEPTLWSAVNEASTTEQCEAADQRIRQLAIGWRK